MRRFGAALLAAAILVVVLRPVGARASGDAGQAVAITRCDSKNINDYEDQIRNWEAHPARGGTDELKRLNDLQDVIAGLGQERGVLDAVCPDNMSRAPFYNQIAADTAWAYVLQAQTSLALGPPCPTAGTAIPNQLVASAWLSLAGNAREMGSVTPPVAKMIPKVQAAAAKIAMNLPSFDETSQYWVNTIADATKQAIADCHLPPPTPSPTPSPVETPGE